MTTMENKTTTTTVVIGGTNNGNGGTAKKIQKQREKKHRHYRCVAGEGNDYVFKSYVKGIFFTSHNLLGVSTIVLVPKATPVSFLCNLCSPYFQFILHANEVVQGQNNKKYKKNLKISIKKTCYKKLIKTEKVYRDKRQNIGKRKKIVTK